MSLYAMQKFLFTLNREPDVQRRYPEGDARAALLDGYELDRRRARGDRQPATSASCTCWACNGQLLMHFAPLLGMPGRTTSRRCARACASTGRCVPASTR